MPFDFAEISGRDSIKFNCLREVLAGEIKLGFQLFTPSPEDYKEKIHSPESRVKVYGNFNLSEDPAGEVLTVRVVMVERPLKIFLSFPENFNQTGKNFSVFRSSTKSIEKEYELSNLTEQIDFIPNQNKNYSIKISAKPEDPSRLASQLEDFKSRAESAEQVVQFYSGEGNAQSVQEILNAVKIKLSEAEEKLSTLITAREQKTKEIESEIKK
ncbi:MAG: hypothetical protein IJR94_08160 [Synergistaceae bacterium]|nr:hypothetical protein [Synergistaceae bacterium]